MTSRSRSVLVRAGAVAAASAAVLAGGTVAGGPSGADLVSPAYVALGDSYSSLPAAATVGGTQQERSCGRSTGNYPKLVAGALGLDRARLRDNTCGGAKTADAFVGQRAGSAKTGFYAAPPQLEGITASTSLVTVSLGGNDGDLYSGILQACAGAPGARTVRCTADQRTRPAALSDDAVTALLSRITADNQRIVRAVRERSPRARILLVGYPVMFDGDRSCGPIAPYRAESVRWIRSVLTQRLNRAMRQAAVAERAEFIDMEPASAGRGLCSSQPWINGVDKDPRAAELHPFPEEGRAVAATIIAHLRDSGFRP
ncbi:SGNH/GDSL hydrolase family protein [Tsukamurella serpentis]